MILEKLLFVCHKAKIEKDLYENKEQLFENL